MARSFRYWVAALSMLCAGMAGCDDDGGGNGNGDTGGDAADVQQDADTGAGDAVDDADTGDVERTDCDPLMETACSLPWPSNLYLAEDSGTETGFRLSFGARSLPQNSQGRNIDPEPWRRLDGYGVSTPIIVHFDNLDVSDMPDELHVADSLADDARVLLYSENEDGDLERVPYWVELDRTADLSEAIVLYIRPAVLLHAATRYVVALRNLNEVGGAEIEPSDAFAALLDGSAEGTLAERQEVFDAIFADLEAAGVTLADLDLAWDFTTASYDTMHGNLVAMRDDALNVVGPSGPSMTVTEVIEYAPTADDSGLEVNEHIGLELRGTFTVPHYMQEDPDRAGAYLMNVDANGDVVQNGTYEPRFWIRIPHSALDGEGTPHGIIPYGHGLNGEGSQVRGGFNSKIAADHGYIFYATDWHGMSEEDVSNILVVAGELGTFPWISDRMHQGVLNFILLGRAMEGTFQSLPEVTDRGIVVDNDRHFYSGISQGGIYGATLAAVSNDITRAHLGVPGQNYSLLLNRSVDFEPFFAVVAFAYRRAVDQAIGLAVIQSLWDSVDPGSWYRRLTEFPIAGNDPTHVLLAPAKGDYQVATVSNIIVARSGIGVEVMENYGRELDLITEQTYPHTGSGIVSYDFGNPWPEVGNLPPHDDVGDPHGKPRRLDHHNEQMIHFFETGEIIDTCGGDGCTPD